MTRQRGRALVVTLALLVTVLPLGTPSARAADRPAGLEPAAGRLAAGDPAQAGGAAVTTLSIPSIGVTEIVRSGVAISVIDKGPAHWMGTSEPGGSGNMVLAGHRTTKTRPFYNIDRLKPGDLIMFTTVSPSDGFPNIAIYNVTETLLVDPQDVWITYETGEAIVTLFACHPKGSARQRIVVRGSLVTTTTLQGLAVPSRHIADSMLGVAPRTRSRY